MKKKKLEAGFSLIELMMVVVIIGVLAGVAVPQYQNFQMKARQSEVKSLLSSMYTAQKAFYAEFNQYYADFNAVGYGLSGELGYNVGFTSNIPGPPSHPNPTYNNATVTSNMDARAYCNVAANGCGISKSKVTNLPTAAAQAGTFTFAGRANLDDDPATDDWTIDSDKMFAQSNDDIAKQ